MDHVDMQLRPLRQEILFARERVYHFGDRTPLERLHLPGRGPEIWVKREDLSAVKSYKWRGACNRMACLSEEEKASGVVTASAGNHAQGMALAAKKLKVKARIYMPRSTPKVKQVAVKQHGGEFVEIILSGDSYDEAVRAAYEDRDQTGAVYVHAYDEMKVMAGQGTLADEVVLSGHGPFDVAFLQIGGGGLAAGVSTWLRACWPGIELIGVEARGQASMKAALESESGERVSLDHVDLFCDGTAVRVAGENTFAICKKTLSRVETVTNAEVSHAMRVLWEGLRCISEPSGALGLAAALKNLEALEGKKVLVVVSGANIDFLQLGLIAQSVGEAGRSTLRVRIAERAGSMLELLDTCFAGVNITDFQYGKADEKEAWPVFTVDAENTRLLDTVKAGLTERGYVWEDITGAEDVVFRAIPLRGDLLKNPVFLRLDFYERPGALHDFMEKRVRNQASICYFNYRQSGERIGRALIGLEFSTAEGRDEFVRTMPRKHGEGYRLCEVVEEAACRRLQMC